MAKELTFSKKGKPLGPNRNPKEGEKRQWSRAEDNYLRMAVRDGISLETVCARLGRTRYSVVCRKSKLGIEGRFSKIRKTQGSKVAVERQLGLFDQVKAAKPEKTGVQVMVLESGFEVPNRGRKQNEEARQKMRGLFEQMKTGQSFVVPKNLLYVATHVANREFSSYKIRTSATSPEKAFYRIFRTA